MTAKRFTVPKQYRCIQDNQTEEKYLCEDKSEAIALANLLNALHEENQKCKEYNGILYANHTKTDRELVKQISELKQENEELKDSVMSWCNSYKRLSEENEGLRIKIRKLRLEKIHQNKENEELKSSDTITDPETEIMKLKKENEQLKDRLKDWHQKTFKAHEYFNLLEKVIDEVCDDDISNQIWKEYEKREKLIE